MLLKLCRLGVFVLVAVSTALSTRTAVAWPGLSAALSGDLGVGAVGACCQANSVCVDGINFSNCFQVGGYWAGQGTTCIANFCGPSGGCCVNGICTPNQSQRYCDSAQFGTWVPVCGDPNCNPTGACCIEGVCSEQTQNLCFLNGGLFIGGGSTCDGSTCNGSCCLPDKAGCQELTEAQCNAVGGAFNGVGTFCGGFACPGACCGDTGGCYVTIPYDCFINGGSFVGGFCESANCVSPVGACCLLSGACEDGAEFGLCTEFGGAWAGPNSICAQTNCQDTGSCCFEFSAGQFFCQRNTFDSYCIDQGGTWNGPGTTCSPNPCGVVIPTGACCFTGGCQQFTPTQCQNVGGLYRGDDTLCTPNGCCPADFNNDGSVNTPDLTYFLGRFGQSFLPPGSERADLIPDGVVNTLDLTRFLSAFGRLCPY